MASDSLTTDFPPGYREEGIDATHWVDYLAQMVNDLKVGEPRSYSLVGKDMDLFQSNRDAFRYLAAYNGVTLRFGRMKQVCSLSGLHEMENVELLNPANTPDFFFDLKQGAVAIPMDDTEDGIGEHYDAGYPIWTAQVTITKFVP